MTTDDALISIYNILTVNTPNNIIINGDSIYIGSQTSRYISQAHTQVYVQKVKGLRLFKIYVKDFGNTNNIKCIIASEDNNCLIMLPFF